MGLFYFLPKARLSKGPHEIMGCCSQKCPGSGVGWVIQGRVGYRGMGWSGMGHAGVGLVIQGWGDTYRALSPSAHSTTWHLLGITQRAKFNYNHTPNDLELLREYKFNYNHKLKPGSFYCLSSGRLSEGPCEIQGCCSQKCSGEEVGGVKVGHKNTEYHKKFAYVMLNWMNVTNIYHIVDFNINLEAND